MENALELLELVTRRFPPPLNTRHSLTMDGDKKLVLCVVRPDLVDLQKPLFVHLTLESSDLSYKPYELAEKVEALLNV